MITKLQEWASAPASNGAALIIALFIGLILAICAGLGAETSAKEYARHLFDQISERIGR